MYESIFEQEIAASVTPVATRTSAVFISSAGTTTSAAVVDLAEKRIKNGIPIFFSSVRCSCVRTQNNSITLKIISVAHS